MGKGVRPGEHELFSVQLAPLPDEAHGPAGDTTGEHLQRCDLDSDAMLPVTGVEMRGRVLGPVQGDDDAVELAQPGHRVSLSASDAVGSSRRLLNDVDVWIDL